ncbi:MAG: glycoside hydrolase family 1 protein [bacterium]
MEYKFPEGFLWGSATSAHQVEGGNFNDWTEWEKANAQRLADEAKGKWQEWQREKFPEMFEPENYISGQACDHYNRYEQDFDIARELGHNAHRFSIEWSRIEPEEGKFNEAEIEHYRKVIKAMKERGLEPFFTISHWTLPIWFREQNGWQSSGSVRAFAKFVDYVARAFKDEVKFWITLNEPWVYISHCYLRGMWPPQKKSFYASLRVLMNLISAHKTAFNVIKSISSQAQVGISENNIYFEGWLSWLAHYWVNRRFLDNIRKRVDFIGLNYYFHSKVRGFKFNQNDNEKISDMGWEIYPKGIYHVLKKLKKYQKPIYITENGIADSNDEERVKFIKDHLVWIHKAIEDSVPVRGYFYWSLLDNFEWDKGFWPRFGLVEIDYKTLGRKIRPSAFEYAKICKENKLIL